ncbi:MAG: rhamnogalacturonan acetylesterase [Massilia sp.]
MSTFFARRRAIAVGRLSLILASAVLAATPALALAQQAYRFALDPSARAEGAVPIARTERYDPAKGYGFTDVKDGNEMSLAMKLAPGDYRVRVSLGAAQRQTRTTLWAEDRRLMAAPVVLRPGEQRTVEFIVNVRNPALLKSEHDVTPTPAVRLLGDETRPDNRTWDERLTVAASGDVSALRAIEVEPVSARRIFLAGDSTVTDQAGGDYASWGQMLPRFLAGGVAVANHARSGETMKSFVASLRWDKLLSDARAGDILLIQFGHNDQKQQWPRTYLDPDLGYPAWLRAFAAEATQRGMKVVLIAPVARRSFNAAGKITNTLAGYDSAVRKAAAELKLPFVDLTALTTTLYETLGPAKSPLAFASKGADKTHHNAYGAWLIANWVAGALTDPANGLDVKPSRDFAPFDPAKPPDPSNVELTPFDWPVMREQVSAVSGS